jgi:hypothetical protein
VLFVSFSRYFPATAWVGRRLSSRIARRRWLTLAVVVLVTTTSLRIHSAILQHRVHSILEGLAQVHLDHTTQAELQTLVPELRLGRPSWSSSQCPAEACLYAEVQGWDLVPFFQSEGLNEVLYKAGYWLGSRNPTFSATAVLQNGVVQDLGYSLKVDDGTFSYRGVVTVAVISAGGYYDRGLIEVEDESPEFRVSAYFKWPEKDLKVVFTPRAPEHLVSQAFDVRLNCLWYLRGCQTAREILPAAWAQKQRIEQAVVARLRGTDPCPDRILPRRARDVANILLVEVERSYVTKDCDSDRCTRPHHIADYRLIKVLKGTLDRPLKNVGHSHTLFGRRPDYELPNPALRLLTPGRRVLMFSDRSTNVNSPCEIVSATPSALATLEAALASTVEEGDRVPWWWY